MRHARITTKHFSFDVTFLHQPNCQKRFCHSYLRRLAQLRLRCAWFTKISPKYQNKTWCQSENYFYEKMDIAGVPSPCLNWDANNLPEAWRKFKLHMDLMFSGPFKKKGEDEKCRYSFGSETKAETFTTRWRSWRKKERYLSHIMITLKRTSCQRQMFALIYFIRKYKVLASPLNSLWRIYDCL